MVELTGNIRPFRGPWYALKLLHHRRNLRAENVSNFYPEFLAGDVVTQFDS